MAWGSWTCASRDSDWWKWTGLAISIGADCGCCWRRVRWRRSWLPEARRRHSRLCRVAHSALSECQSARLTTLASSPASTFRTRPLPVMSPIPAPALLMPMALVCRPRPASPLTTARSGALSSTPVRSPASTSGHGILVTNGAVVLGGLSNSGTISANVNGVFVGATVSNVGVSTISTFVGGISNSGTIASGSANGIVVGGRAVGTHAAVSVMGFSGGIANNGTINAPVGILVGGIASGSGVTVAVSNFSGGIKNSVTITSFNPAGIFVGGFALGEGALSQAAAVVVSTFSGGVTNTGKISSANGAGVLVGGTAAPFGSVTIGNFSQGISNSGTIAAAHNGVWVGGAASGLHQCCLICNSLQLFRRYQQQRYDCGEQRQRNYRWRHGHWSWHVGYDSELRRRHQQFRDDLCATRKRNFRRRYGSRYGGVSYNIDVSWRHQQFGHDLGPKCWYLRRRAIVICRDGQNLCIFWRHH